MTDTTAKRRAKARRLIGDGMGIVARLVACPGRLYHLVYVFEEGVELYTEGGELARHHLQALIPDLPQYVRVCLSRAEALHVHILASIPDAECLSRLRQMGFHCRAVNLRGPHLARLLEYLSRPYDERASRPDRRAALRYSATELLDQRFAAAEAYLQARRAAQGQRLPRLSWTRNLPLLRAEPYTLYRLAVLRKAWATRPEGAENPTPLDVLIPHVTMVVCRQDWPNFPRGPPPPAGYVARPLRPLIHPSVLKCVLCPPPFRPR
ncbi:hypothetical protein [Deinococcus sedimenti]|uniref:hypothetical protein n=1 Tax=Deinococcus sedimenti TaxID=1867090 RepID=UPI00166A0CC3|nr:hypothetical protein [Deinococcus sedimenti]